MLGAVYELYHEYLFKQPLLAIVGSGQPWAMVSLRDETSHSDGHNTHGCGHLFMI